MRALNAYRIHTYDLHRIAKMQERCRFPSKKISLIPDSSLAFVLLIRLRPQARYPTLHRRPLFIRWNDLVHT